MSPAPHPSPPADRPLHAEHPYDALTPELVLAAIEALGLACDGRLLALNSFENRVYRVGIEDAPPLVAKFYRPERWSDAAIIEEHAFTAELALAELPTVPPLVLADGSLHRHQGFRFALFPVRGGRAPEPDHPDTLHRLGTLLGRIHAIGGQRRFIHRPTLAPIADARAAGDVLVNGGWLPSQYRTRFDDRLAELLDALAVRLDQVGPQPLIRLHGDCHLGNLLWCDDSAHFVDFDDACTGPAVQDLWMLLSGARDDQDRQWHCLLDGYSRFADIDPAQRLLVEPLRAVRLLRHHAWIANRWHDPAFPAAFPGFAEARHWDGFLAQFEELLASLTGEGSGD